MRRMTKRRWLREEIKATRQVCVSVTVREAVGSARKQVQLI